jgi:hypothetical protein
VDHLHVFSARDGFQFRRFAPQDFGINGALAWIARQEAIHPIAYGHGHSGIQFLGGSGRA